LHYSDIKKRVHTILDNPEKSDKRTQQVHVLIAVAILINAFAIILYSVKEISSLYSGILNLVINSCLLLFAVEYTLRIWSCTDTKNPLGMVTDRVKYAMSFYLIIDLLSIIPIFIPFILPNQITLIRLLRLVSIFKLGRFTKYSKSLEQLKRVFKRKSEIFVIMLFFLVFILLFSSVIMYVVEYSAQPDKFSSIPASLWWAVMTVTTVGYGDIIPVTPLGKIIASIVTLTGVLILALPSAILATGFIEERQIQRNQALKKEMTPEAKLLLIEKLWDLKTRGMISEDEYDNLKSEILAGQGDE
jgi:voltage-gated potassium channel